MVWELSVPAVSPSVAQVGRNRSCHAQGEPPRPPASPEGAVVVLEVPISTVGSCWKTLEILGTGTAQGLPQRGATQGCTDALGSFCGRGGGGGGKEPTRPWDLLCQCHSEHPTGQDPPGAEQEGEEHPWVAKRGECVQHLARKMLVATETRHFPSPFWAICVLGRREGLPVTYQLHRTCCLSLLNGSAGVLRRPPTPRSSLLRVFGALRDVDGSKSSPQDGICCSGGAPRAETPSLG